MDLPVHGSRRPVKHLHPVHADVAHTSPRILRDHRRERHKRRRVARPAGLHRERAEIDLVAGQDDLVRRPPPHCLRQRVRDRLQLLEAAHLVDQALRRLHLEHVLELLRDVVEPLDAEGQAHPPLGAELVDQQRMV